MINFNNPEGWERYKKVSEEHAQEIRDSVDNIQDSNGLRINIHIINMEIQVEVWNNLGGTQQTEEKVKERQQGDQGTLPRATVYKSKISVL